MRKLIVGYFLGVSLLLICGMNCSSQVPNKEYKQSLITPLLDTLIIENQTFKCNLKQRLHFKPNMVIKHCIFMWKGEIDAVWVPEHTSRDVIAILTGENIRLEDCMFVGDARVNPISIDQKQ